jgi:hypothetical protein
VSRLEKRTDILISTLSRYIEAMGGKLYLVAKFPERDPVVLSGIADDDPDPRPARRKRKLARVYGREAVARDPRCRFHN